MSSASRTLRHSLVLDALPIPHPLGIDSQTITVWSPQPHQCCFDEALVSCASAALSDANVDSLLIEWPPQRDGVSQALAWSALEAARRAGEGLTIALFGDLPAEIRDSGDAETSQPQVAYLVAARLFDVWPALWTSASTDQLPPGVAPASVSVIVRSMDRPSLKRTLDSVAWQTHRQVEVVVVNARGAGHSRVEPIHLHPPVRLVPSAEAAPLERAQAANVGLDAANAKYVLFLDDDDLLLPDHLAKLVQFLDESPEYVAAYSDVDFGRIGSTGWLSEHRFAAEFDPIRLFFENFLPIHAVLFRRDLVAQGVRVDEQLKLLEDWDFWLQCAALGPIAHVPGVSARYAAGSEGESGVFLDTDLARQSRDMLFAKWHPRMSAPQYVALMSRLQSHYRGEQHALAQERLAKDEIVALRHIVRERDREVADGLKEIDSLRFVVAARDREVADALKEISNWREIVEARDREISDLHAALEKRSSLTQVPGAAKGPQSDASSR